VKKIALAAATLSLFATCRGEAPPRDYQNNPPAMTHPVTSSAQAPAQNGMPGPGPEPNKGAEGKSGGKPVDPTAPSTTLGDQAPSTKT
jgi:hypothetical protein